MVFDAKMKGARKVAERGQACEKLEELAGKLTFDRKPIEDSYMPPAKWIKEYRHTNWLDIVTMMAESTLDATEKTTGKRVRST